MSGGGDPLLALAREETGYTLLVDVRIPLVTDDSPTYVLDWVLEQFRVRAADEPPEHAQLVDITSGEEGVRFVLGDPPAAGAETSLPPVTFVVRGLPALVSGGAPAAVGALAFRFDAPVSVLGGLPPLAGGDSTVTFADGTATLAPIPDLGLLASSPWDRMNVTTTADAAPLSFEPEEHVRVGDMGLSAPFSFGETPMNVTYSAQPFAGDLRVDLTAEPEPSFDIGVLGPAQLNVTATAVPPELERPLGLGLGPEPARRPWVKIAAGAAAAVAVLVIGGALLLGGGDEPAPEPAPAAAPEPAPEAELPAAWAQPSGLVADAGATSFEDPTGDFIYSVPGITPGDPAPDVDIVAAEGGMLDLTAAQAAALSAEPAYACGTAAACADDDAPLPAGPLFVFSVAHAGAPPAEAGATDHTYALVFDANGDAADNFAFEPPFEWDFYRGTDRWYQLVRDGADWSLDVRSWRSDRSVLAPSAARAVLDGEMLTWLVPMSELETDDPGWRVTAFRHDGTFEPAASAGDVLGADPTQPLAHLGP